MCLCFDFFVLNLEKLHCFVDIFAAEDDDHDIDYDDEDGGKNKPPSLFGPCDLSTLQEGQHKGGQHGITHCALHSEA